MKALLLSAGLGTRLRPLTDVVPKCLIPIGGTPLLKYWINMLTAAGVGPILVNTHHLAYKVAEFIKQNRYENIVHTVYEEKLLGTAGTLLKNEGFFATGTLMLVHADNLSRFNVAAFMERHRRRPQGCEITMMTFKTPTPKSCGIVELDKREVVMAFHEKVENPPGNLANAAVYILEPTIFGFLRGIGKEIIDFSMEVLPHYMGRIYTFHNDVYHKDIGTPQSYEAAQVDFAQI